VSVYECAARLSARRGVAHTAPCCPLTLPLRVLTALTTSVTKAEVIDAIYQQTGRKLDDAELVVPEIKAVGTFECSVKLVSCVAGAGCVVECGRVAGPCADPVC
jgi:hypothetical protein